ncbi:Acyl-CoA dehydrogenase domain protein [Parafrankia sp. Ea1.12]|uniref:acyl-CoA dehydrogenase family protein n=1 Tax=Parafrankia sp. Ea1.12 TaxID=573499 RepID=UPI000DA50621|nr:acyl-CoA dehydrogenase family protein [Parafrankia sp. Ea1.12]SQE00328.1 Acyl-CoA dehydrogenase domain protein [Parafrankia sp. Ea1.12]
MSAGPGTAGPAGAVGAVGASTPQDVDDLRELHRELRDVARDMLRKTTGRTGDDEAPVPVDWSLLAGSGWLGLEVPEELDGAGATFAEVAVVLHEIGRAAASSGYLGSAVLGVGALRLLEPGAGRDELLAAVAAGEQRLAVALPAGDDVTIPFHVRPATPGDAPGVGGGARVDGTAGFVLDAAEADQLLLVALDPTGVPVVVRVRPDDPGVTVTGQPVVDETRSLGTVTVDGAVVDAGSVWQFGTDPQESVRRLLDRAALAVACDCLGLAEAMLEATVDYAGTRRQFGRPIGSFQAVKHACADMFVRISVGRELLAAGVAAVASDDPQAGVAVSRAKSYVCVAAVDVAGRAMQLHGGIGYTWEGGVHVYLKRALLGRALFGAPAAHRARLAARFAEPADDPLTE